MQDPRLDSCLVPCYLSSHPRNNIIELILLHLVPMVPHHLGSRTSPPFLRLLHSRRIDLHICLPDLLGLFLLALEEVVDRETIDKLLVNPTPILVGD